MDSIYWRNKQHGIKGEHEKMWLICVPAFQVLSQHRKLFLQCFLPRETHGKSGLFICSYETTMEKLLFLIKFMR